MRFGQPVRLCAVAVGGQVGEARALVLHRLNYQVTESNIKVELPNGGTSGLGVIFNLFGCWQRGRCEFHRRQKNPLCYSGLKVHPLSDDVTQDVAGAAADRAQTRVAEHTLHVALHVTRCAHDVDA